MTEEVTAFDLPVTGSLPAGLSGRYLRNRPNPLGLDDPNYHWFLSAGMVHGVRLRDGRAEWYRNRWVRSQAVAAQHHVRQGPLAAVIPVCPSACDAELVPTPWRSARARKLCLAAVGTEGSNRCGS
ncbi:MAG: carotenoid oxygenase family protein [Streptosporangiaceae bacterium]